MSNQLIESVKQTFCDALVTLENKNHDYAGDADPYRNFKFSEQVGVDLQRAILVRLSDKLSRVSNLIDRDPKVAGESVNDTIEDAINYLAILKAYRESLSE